MQYKAAALEAQGDGAVGALQMPMGFDPALMSQMAFAGVPASASSSGPVAEADRTTIMLRNLPNDYTRDMVLDLLDRNGFLRCYDFVYLPVDFKRKAGLGYAFVNMVSHAEAERSFRELQGFCAW